MPRSPAQAVSPWQRSRYWATAACCTVATTGVLTLWAGHLLHGSLMLLAAALLVRHTVLARGYRRRVMEAALPGTPSVSQARKWRKAA